MGGLTLSGETGEGTDLFPAVRVQTEGPRQGVHSREEGEGKVGSVRDGRVSPYPSP